MDRHTNSNPTHAVQQLRAAMEPGLPYGASLIPLDILIAVSAAHQTGQPLTLKALVHSLPYSVTGVRYNIDQLVSYGWIEKSRAKGDRRTILLWPTEKVDTAFRQVASAI